MDYASVMEVISLADSVSVVSKICKGSYGSLWVM